MGHKLSYAYHVIFYFKLSGSAVISWANVLKLEYTLETPESLVQPPSPENNSVDGE